MAIGFPKPSRADRLRRERTSRGQAKAALTALYRHVYRRDGFKCVACKKSVVVGGLNELTRAHPHHIRARSLVDKALKHTSQNLATVCSTCHADVTEHRLWITGNADKHLTIRRTKAA